MKKIIYWLNESAYIPPLSPGCKMCAEGAKLVVFSTGLCSSRCFYCPLSFRKGGKDRIFVDEWELDSEDDMEKLLLEAKYIDAKGAGITGGDPLEVWKRVKKYITLLKDAFGSSFHIHLYTSALKNTEYVSKLVNAGLDEIRFHPLPEYWKKMDQSPISIVIKDIRDLSLDIALEIPLIPTMNSEIIKLIQWADALDLRWVNLNELEFSERNCNNLLTRGFVVKNDISAAVKESQESALSILKTLESKNLGIGVHYCSLSFKDGIQLSNRIKRRAQNIVKKYEIITEEGTLLKGVIMKKKTPPRQILICLNKEYHIPKKYLYLDDEKNRVETAVWILEDIAAILQKKGYSCFIIEEYPTADRLEIERIPLPLDS